MTQGYTDGTRLVVTSGLPNETETVAVLLALDAARRTDTPRVTARRPAWVTAARREGVGGALAATRSDLGGWGR